MRKERTRLLGIILALTVIVLLIGVAAQLVHRLLVSNKNASSLYIIASSSKENSGEIQDVRVDIWIDGKLRVKDVSGSYVPIISLQPGIHTVRVVALGYHPHVQSIDVTPRSEVYVYAEFR